MSDAFTPQVRALLDRLEPPALSADFADRLVAAAEATPGLPSLPRLRERRLRRPLALAVAAAGLAGVAAAAAVVPAEVWRNIPVVGEIVELIAPAKVPLPAPARIEPAPAARAVSVPALRESAPQDEPELRRVAETPETPQPVEDGAVVLPPGGGPGPSVAQPEPVERAGDAQLHRVQTTRATERSAAGEATATVVETRAEPAPGRPEPADAGETRQQVRERTTATRQTTRERLERRERRPRPRAD